MAYQVRYTGLAAHEVKEAFAWYLDQAGETVAEGFMDEVARAEGHLRSNPFLYQRVADEVRHLVLRRYPYALIYSISGDAVHVLGCFHSSRQPLTLAAWLGRESSDVLPKEEGFH
jgi:plasmid stabilization system protein ParE